MENISKSTLFDKNHAYSLIKALLKYMLAFAEELS